MNDWADAMRDLSDKADALLAALFDGTPESQLDEMQAARDAAYYRALSAGLSREQAGFFGRKLNE